MIIKRVHISNYKTYLSLDLDLSVDDDRPIILIGGMNGGGKTTLFEAICGALYGLNIRTKEEFEELLNNGAVNSAKPEIQLDPSPSLPASIQTHMFKGSGKLQVSTDRWYNGEECRI